MEIDRPEEPLTRPLTVRKMDVLRLLVLGWDTEHIGAELGVTDHTLRNHITNLRVKLSARSRFEAVMVATRLRILTLGNRWSVVLGCVRVWGGSHEKMGCEVPLISALGDV